MRTPSTSGERATHSSYGNLRAREEGRRNDREGSVGRIEEETEGGCTTSGGRGERGNKVMKKRKTTERDRLLDLPVDDVNEQDFVVLRLVSIGDAEAGGDSVVGAPAHRNDRLVLGRQMEIRMGVVQVHSTLKKEEQRSEVIG
jgi:hypothetical protein